MLDLSVIHSVLNTSFVFTLILGYLFLGEVLTKKQWFGTIIVMIGVTIIMFIDNPATGQMTEMNHLIILGLVSAVLITALIVTANHVAGLNFEILYAIAAGIAFGNGQVTVKAATNSVTESTGDFSVLSMQSLAEVFNVWPSLGVIIFSVVGFICMQISFAHGKVSITVALMAVISRAISTSSGYFIFGELFPFEKLVGIMVILTGVFIITFVSVRAQPETVLSTP